MKCGTDDWCELYDVDLSNSAFSKGGVYVIWYISKKDKRKTLRVGQAKVLRERLAANRGDEDIKDYATRHTLYVTWAHVGADQHDGVEAYLGQALSPKLAERFPDEDPIAANLPWS
jgi:hypothetical protein